MAYLDGIEYGGAPCPSQFGELMDKKYPELHPETPILAVLAIERCLEVIKESNDDRQVIEEAALEIAVCARALWEEDF